MCEINEGKNKKEKKWKKKISAHEFTALIIQFDVYYTSRRIVGTHASDVNDASTVSLAKNGQGASVLVVILVSIYNLLKANLVIKMSVIIIYSTSRSGHNVEEHNENYKLLIQGGKSFSFVDSFFFFWSIICTSFCYLPLYGKYFNQLRNSIKDCRQL